MQMLGGRPDASGGTASFNPNQQRQPAPQQQQAPQQQNAPSNFDAPPVDEGFDDIPF